MSRPGSLLRTALCLLPLVGCASSESKPPAPPPAEPSAATAEPAPSASAEPPRPRKPFEVYSACSDVVTVVFAEDAKAQSAGKRTIAPSSSIEGARNPDGNQTVWLLDQAGEPLVKVHVTRGMKRVEIGKSCRTLDAR